jgi:DNA-binding Lrp family transcriptional regulator
MLQQVGGVKTALYSARVHQPTKVMKGEPNGRGIEQEVDRFLTVRAILHIFVEPGKIEDVGEALARIPEVIDIYEVTGEYDLIATAKTNDLHQLRSLISEKLMKMHGVKAVTTSVVLHTYKLNGKAV